MTCPKCHGEMRMYERSGVTIDQCTECRGIFLDRGELEKLFEAEANWNSRQAPSAPWPQQAPGAYAPPPAHGGGHVPPPPPPGYGAPAHPAAAHPYDGHAPQYVYHGHYRHHGHYHHKRRKSFLNELFD